MLCRIGLREKRNLSDRKLRGSHLAAASYINVLVPVRTVIYDDFGSLE